MSSFNCISTKSKHRTLQTYSLFELNEYIRRILALNLPEAIWVTCEIAQLNVSRGNHFLELVEKSAEDDTIIARTEAAIWGPTYKQLKRKVGKKLLDILQEGLEVKMQVSVSFHERYGLKMVVEDVDPTYTLGKLALKRQQTIDQLEAAGKLYLNAQLELRLSCSVLPSSPLLPRLVYRILRTRFVSILTIIIIS